MTTEVLLPELAEGIEKGDIISILVKEGDLLDLDTPLVEVESEKATLTVPSPVRGKVARILVKQGDKVKVGAPIVLVESGAEPTETTPIDMAPKVTAANQEDLDETAMQQRFEQIEEPSIETVSSKPLPPPVVVHAKEELIPAGPAVRRIARELGINLNIVQGSGKNGRILVEDLDPYIRAYVNQRGGGAVAVAGPGFAPVELPDFSKFGPVRREKADTLRRKIAEKMQQSWSSVPHVHQFADADITDLLALQKRYKEKVKQQGGALTMTVFALKAISMVLQEFPQFNCSYDVANQEIIFKDYIHVGVAVDTPNGLIVPVLRDVDKKSLIELAVELNALAQKTRDRKTSIDDLRGGSFTISNLGGIGGTHFTPIINTPEVAILGIGRSTRKPVFDAAGQVVGRDILPICLGYDHRVIDGADGARFISRLVYILENFEAAVLGF